MDLSLEWPLKKLRYVIKQIENRKYDNIDFRDIGTDILGKDVVELYELEKAFTVCGGRSVE